MIPTAVRMAVDVRDQRHCVRCGIASRELHHRQRRREGGHGLDNIVSLCGTCHRWAHSHPNDARDTGFIVSLYVTEIALVPVRMFSGDWVHLLPDGTISYTKAPTTEER